MPSEAQLAGMRARYTARLKRRCTVTPNTGADTPDAYGGHTTGAGTPVTDVPYSFSSAAGDERLAGAQLAQVGRYVLRFPHDQALNPEAVVTDEADGTKVFHLIAPLDRARPVGQEWLAQTRS